MAKVGAGWVLVFCLARMGAAASWYTYRLVGSALLFYVHALLSGKGMVPVSVRKTTHCLGKVRARDVAVGEVIATFVKITAHPCRSFHTDVFDRIPERSRTASCRPIEERAEPVHLQ